MAGPAQVNVNCPQCHHWVKVDHGAGAWECLCGDEFTAMRCPSCRLVQAVRGDAANWHKCGSCEKPITALTGESTTTAAAYARTLKWRGLAPGDAEDVIIFGNRVISATGIKVSPDRLVSLAVDPDKLTIAGIDDDGSAFRAAVPRSSLIDLRIELRDAAAADAVAGFTNFTILGKAVGRSFSSLINKVTGHTPPQQTIITIASARAIVVMNNSEITPEDADALFAPVEVDVSANRKKIIEAHNAGAASEEHVITILGELAELHQSGVLTDQEFSRKKAQILARI